MPEAGKHSIPSASLHGREYSFSDLVPLYGLKFSESLAKAWETANRLGRRQPTEKRLAALKRLLKWLATQDLPSADDGVREVYHLLRDDMGRGILEVQWRDVVNAFCDRVRDHNCMEIIETPNILTRRSIIQFLSAALRDIAGTGLLPNAGPLKSCGRGQLSGGNIPALCELQIGKRGRSAFPAPLPNQAIAALAESSRVRLAALRARAVEKLTREYAIFERGQELMRRTDLPSPERFEAAVETRVMSSILVTLPSDEAGQLAGLLSFVNCRRQNRLYVRIEHYPMQVLVARLGGAEYVLRHLEGTIDALVAAYTIVLIDTGFDIGTCDNLPANPFVGDVRSGRQRIATISAIKIRAGGNVAEAVLLDGEADLPTKLPGQPLSGVTAIKMWQKMSEPLRERARSEGSEAANLLWVIASGSLNQGPIRLVDAVAFKSAWNRFLVEIGGDEHVGGLPIQRRMIRPTVLQVRAAENDFEYAVPQALANHSRPRMTMRYLGTAWFRAELARRIREFQELYEASAVNDIREAAERLGLTPGELQHRHATALDTGLGFVCLDPRQGIQPGTSSGETCTRLDACAHCPLRRFVPTNEGLVALVLFNKALREQAPAFQAGNPERWAVTWLPHLALTEAIISKLEDGPHRPKLRRGREEAERRLVSGEAVLPRLW